ncbi:hypothetical protein FLAVO9AF_270021 [Flavobacterium sp. 9AF]|uniref:hypothetical protein n=1 Tax=Flavobacterium sp. 9AF TaxID=2653142 RepID=UPI0012F2B867|nr:hypothetical protein [Flavobacterium sp. 9AF]VXB78219.1 hypothetical protein FLAVO9AF_270021 [Flavobacterium sp. 9AF]
MRKIIKISSIAFLVGLLFFISCEDENLGKDEDETLTKSFVIDGKIKQDGMLIGKEINNELVLLLNNEELKKLFSEINDEQGLDHIEYSDFKILKKEIEISGEIEVYYGLYANDKDHNFNTAIELKKTNDTLSLYSKGGTITCTSTNCGIAGCLPVQTTVTSDGQSVKVWTCSTCSQRDGTCSKTATISIEP